MPVGRLTHHLVETGAFAAQPLVVVDVGCAGGFEDVWARFGGQARMVGFDPNVPDASWPGGATHGRAAGGFAGERVFYRASHPNSCGLLPPDPAWVRRFPWGKSMSVVGEGRVHTVTVDEVLVADGLTADYAKMDVEGLEVEVLTGSPGLVRSCVGMSLEAVFFPVRRDQPTFSDVDQFMRRAGYMVAIVSPYRHFRATLSYCPFPENRGQMVWAQSLWVRDAWAEMEAGRAAEWPRLRVLKLLCLLDVSGLPDMAIEVAQAAHKWGQISPSELTVVCDLLTPTVDGVQFSYADYLTRMHEVERETKDLNARLTAHQYKAQWGKRLG